MKYVNENRIPNGKVLVPGCGRAYDIVALASPMREVLGIDISDIAVQAAKSWLSQQSLPTNYKYEVKLQNFFDISPASQEDKFDFIYDYTFFCALDPSIRDLWGMQMSKLCKQGGELFTLVFPLVDKPNGPPFGVSFEAYKKALEPNGFECLELEMLPDELCHPDREGKSAVGRWRRL